MDEYRKEIYIDETLFDIVKEFGPELCKIIHSKYECALSIKSMSHKPSSALPDLRFEAKLDSGVRVSVWKADLTQAKDYAVVNAANENLKHSGGLALALSQAGGPSIQKESDYYIKHHGCVKTGDAILCTSGFLPCKWLIHAVGPRVPLHSNLVNEKQQLEKTIRSILNLVKEHDVNSVAIPAISSGIFNYPLPQCADTIVQTVKNYYQNLSPREKRPSEIRFVNHDEPTVREMERACHTFLSSHTTQVYGAAGPSPTKRNAPSAPTSKYSVELGNVVLTLMKDAIEDQQTDVIVNTTSEDRDLSLGVISSAILRKAGPELQKEFRTAHQNGNLIITNAFRLNCKEIYHTFCIAKRGHKATENLRHSVKQCLMAADANNHRSIAFPAIGTGNLGFTKEEVASIMSEEVLEFSKRCQNKMKVHFVIFKCDDDTFKAFEKELRVLQTMASDHNVQGSMELEDSYEMINASPQLSLTDHMHRDEEAPKICLAGSSREATQEAEKWLNDLFKASGHFNIQNNFIQHLSYKQHQLLSSVKNVVSIEEFFTKGHACMTVEGFSTDLVRAVLRVEEMLCKAQEEFISDQLSEIGTMTFKNMPYERRVADKSSPEFTGRSQHFQNQGLRIVKVEAVLNKSLENLFDLKKQQLNCNQTRKMYQCIPAQFCHIVRQIGFHVELAPPEDPQPGEGIYFTSSVRQAKQLWRQSSDRYLYFVEAEVLEGESIPGHRDLILPPDGKSPGTKYDSVTGGAHVCVVFSGYQALPRYIITCEKC